MIRRLLAHACVVALACLSAQAVTLEKLSLDEMVEASTLIVRGTVRSATAVREGAIIATEYEIAVSEVFKGHASAPVRMRLPGGTLSGETQAFAGVPVLKGGDEHVYFLWRGRSGKLQLVGLTQGLLHVKADGSRTVASRPPIDGILLDRKTGLPVRDAGMTIRTRELRGAVERSARGSGGKNQ